MPFARNAKVRATVTLEVEVPTTLEGDIQVKMLENECKTWLNRKLGKFGKVTSMHLSNVEVDMRVKA